MPKRDIELAVASAVIQYNVGVSGKLNILTGLGITGSHSVQFSSFNFKIPQHTIQYKIG